MIKNNKGQYYAVECDNLEQSNEVYEILKCSNKKFYRKYVTTDKFWTDDKYILRGYEIIHFNDWIKLTEPQPETITLPIEDYNKLIKLEIKQEIKKLKRELKGL